MDGVRPSDTVGDEAIDDAHISASMWKSPFVSARESIEYTKGVVWFGDEW